MGETQNVWTEGELLSFKQNLGQVILWTEELSRNFDYQNGKFGYVFRKTNPIYKGSPLYNYGRQSDEINNLNLNIDFGEDYASMNDRNYSLEDYDLLLEQALKHRISNKETDLSGIDSMGRILCFQTCISTHDGAPIVESRNFVDDGDVPPVDTWFYLKRDYYHSGYKCEQSLFCWIPAKFEELMQQAINVEILDSYRWLDENDKEFYERIKA